MSDTDKRTHALNARLKFCSWMMAHYRVNERGLDGATQQRYIRYWRERRDRAKRMLQLARRLPICQKQPRFQNGTGRIRVGARNVEPVTRWKPSELRTPTSSAVAEAAGKR